jgi:hypothetical protein
MIFAHLNLEHLHLYNSLQSSIMHIVQTTTQQIINIKNKKTLINAKHC